MDLSSCIYHLKVHTKPISFWYHTVNYFIKHKAMPVSTKHCLEVLVCVTCVNQHMIYSGHNWYYKALGHSQIPIKVIFYNLNSRWEDAKSLNRNTVAAA